MRIYNIILDVRAGPINDIISNRDKIYVDNDDKLWTLLLDMDWSKSQSHRRNMRQQPISVQRARQSTKSACTSKYKVNFLPHLAKQARHKNDKKMSGTSNESETNLELLSKDDEIVDKKGSTNSVIWEWFGYLKSDEAQIKTICKICRRFVKTKTGNTTNLFHHLKKYHPNDHTESMKMRTDATPSTSRASIGAVPKQKSIVSSFVAITPYEKCSKRSKDITRAVSFFLAKDMIPLSTVERDGFRKLVKVLDSRYELPGRKYFSKTALPQLYEDCRGKLENNLRKVRYFATTSDLWSSRTSEPYMSLTIHYIDEDWDLQSRCLQTAYFPDDHTAEILSAGLEDALTSWGLSEDRQVCITTDNGANIVKAVSLKNWTRLQCFGHRLHLAIGKLSI